MTEHRRWRSRLSRKPPKFDLPTSGGRNQRDMRRNEVVGPVFGRFAAFSHALSQGALMHLISEWLVRQPRSITTTVAGAPGHVHPTFTHRGLTRAHCTDKAGLAPACGTGALFASCASITACCGPPCMVSKAGPVRLPCSAGNSGLRRGRTERRAKRGYQGAAVPRPRRPGDRNRGRAVVRRRRRPTRRTSPRSRSVRGVATLKALARPQPVRSARIDR